MTTPVSPFGLTPRNAIAGIGGALASVMMFYSAFRGGTGLGIVLLPLLPLPALIAGLGWGMGAAVVVVLTSAVVVAAIASPGLAAVYALMLSLPALGTTHVMSLARYDDDGALTHWYPVGRIVMAIALYGAALPVLLIAFDGGSWSAIAPDLARTIKATASKPWVSPDWRALNDEQIKGIADVFVQLMPALVAFYWTLFFLLNVYLAARVVKISGKLMRPWPNLHWMTFPAGFALAPALALTGVWFGGSLRVIGTGALGALLVAFVLQGLSVVHAAAASRKASWLLSLTYTALIVLGTIMTPLLALLGVGEALFHLRRRVISIPAALPPGSL